MKEIILEFLKSINPKIFIWQLLIKLSWILDEFIYFIIWSFQISGESISDGDLRPNNFMNAILYLLLTCSTAT